MYIIRLDDASEYMDIEKWDRIEKLLDFYGIKPIVGIIPNNEDIDLVSKYSYDPNFWNKALKWQAKNWTIALHGYSHVYLTSEGGLNPVNYRSEFAGVSLDIQSEKIAKGVEVLKKHGLEPKLFFAPSHTFDINTLKALKKNSDIRIISDTIANDIYKWKDFHFIPQQAGQVRVLPFKVTTFCYHPNIMSEKDFNRLESFIKKHINKFGDFDRLEFYNRKINIYDKLLKWAYFTSKKIRKKLRG